MTDTVPKARRAACFYPAAQPLIASGAVAFVELSPCTEPAVIAARHREEVSDAYHFLGLDTPEEIGEYQVLATPLVRRHLEAMDVALLPSEPPMSAVRIRRGQIPPLVLACLQKAERPLTTREVAERIGGTMVQSVYYALRARPDLYDATVAGHYRGQPVFAWTLKERTT